MSKQNRRTKDPIIERAEDESDFDNEEVLPSTPGQEHIDLATPAQDAASLLGAVFNGDSLIPPESPFKKSYSNNSIEESTVSSLADDEPLPIESEALSPFRIEPLHNSPLATRSKDVHTFAVSVSDSLPPHVMELDSPERESGDDDDEFDIESATSPLAMERQQYIEENSIIRTITSDVGDKLQGFLSQEIDNPKSQPEIPIEQSQPEFTIIQSQPDSGSIQAPSEITGTHPHPEIKTTQSQPDFTTMQSQAPEIATLQSQPEIITLQSQPEIATLQSQQEISSVPSQDMDSVRSQIISLQCEPEISSVKFHSETASVQSQPLRKLDEESPHLSRISKKKDVIPSSQADLFESQPASSEEGAAAAAKGQTEPPRDGTVRNITAPVISVSSPSRKQAEPPDTRNETSYPVDSSVSQSERFDQEMCGEDLLLKKSLLFSSNTRKRKSYSEQREDLENKLLKTDKSVEEENDSDIEILSEPSSRDESIEVVYDKKKAFSLSWRESECIESQDLRLLLTGDTQSEEAGDKETSSPKDKLFSSTRIAEEEDSPVAQSPSLLSMPDSEGLICRESLSLAPESTPNMLESTIRATQVEILCKPAVLSQPNIRPLLEYPIKDNVLKYNASCANHSTNQLSKVDSRQDSYLSQVSTYSGNNTSQDTSVSHSVNVTQSEQYSDSDHDKSPARTSEGQRTAFLPLLPSSDSSASQSQEVETRTVEPAACFPQFDTPSQDQMQETGESLFVKATKAAEEHLLKEKHQEHFQEVHEKLTFDSSSHQDDFIISTDDQSHSHDIVHSSKEQTTPHCAINLLQSSPSAASSSHPVQETSSSWLFQRMNKERSKDTDVQVSQTYVEDSDEEEKQSKTGQSLEKTDSSKILRKRPSDKASTPNNSAVTSPASTADDQSSIHKESRSSSTAHSLKDNVSPVESRVPSDTPTQDVYADISKMSDENHLIDAGWRRNRIRSIVMPVIEEWIDPITTCVAFTLKTSEGNIVLQDDTSWKKVISFSSESSSSKSGSSRDTRISDISSISRVTGTSGYLADRSSSLSANSVDHGRFESTRLSMASVVTIEHANIAECTIDDEKEVIDIDVEDRVKKQDEGFLYPPKPLPKKSTTISQSEATTSESFATPVVPPPSKSTFTSAEVKPIRPRGRGRPRGRSRGRGRGMERAPVTPIIPIEEDVVEDTISSEHEKQKTPSKGKHKAQKAGGKSHGETPLSEQKSIPETPASQSSMSVCDLPSDFVALLPPDMQRALLEAQIPLSEEEEEIFLLQREKIPSRDRNIQHEEVSRKVRLAEIRSNTLVFARYSDGTFYSAIVLRQGLGDRWMIKYNVDQLVSSVREVYILPTDILPQGLPCFVRHPDRNYSDPGIVVGHVVSHGMRLHLIEMHRGKIMRAPHSHIILRESVAMELLEPRLSYQSLNASPGGDVSLDNIVMGKRRRGTSVSPVKTPSSPLARKPDYNLDTTHSEAEARLSSPKTTVKRRGRVVTAVSDSSSSYEDLRASTTPLSAKKKLLLTPKTPKTPRSRTARTPKTPKTTKSPKTPATSAKKSKKTVESSTEKPAESSSEGHLYPVVELVQLQKTSGDQPATTPKKRGRKPGGSGQNAKKTMKLESENEKSIDPHLGPLPKPGCQVLKGYKILITAPENPRIDEAHGNIIVSFDKSYLMKQITMAGGQVLETFSETILQHMQLSQPRKTSQLQSEFLAQITLPADESPIQFICVSNVCSLTAKFIQCLTAGIPLVRVEWIIDSIRENECMNWFRYLLPAGMSLLTGNLMEQSFNEPLLKFTFGQVPEILKGETVFLGTSTNPGFRHLWMSLLSTAAASIFEMPPKGGNIQRLLDRRTSVVIADETVPVEEVKRAEEVGVPIVSSHWFIQSLLARCKVPYDAHPHFSYKFKKDVVPTEDQR